MIYNQIWLNLVMDDGHFGYITKLTTQKVKYHPLEIPWDSFAIPDWITNFT
jgi:hypothetical protein